MEMRWLETIEVYSMLTKIHLLIQLGYNVQTMHSNGNDYPKSGDLFIFPKELSKQGASIWRNDHLEYNRRKNSSSVQESQVKLKIAQKEVMVCAYAKGAISRRGFWLLENPQFVLVHYLNETEANKLRVASQNDNQPFILDQILGKEIEQQNL